jgi:Rrf2 family protein
MVDIAANTRQGKCISLSCVAKSQSISESYLEQLVSALKKAGLLKSTRGAQGGYELVGEPSQITVGDILRAIEGPMTLVDCEGQTDACVQGACEKCAARDVWERLSDSINTAADGITLEELVDNYIEKQK